MLLIHVYIVCACVYLLHEEWQTHERDILAAAKKWQNIKIYGSKQKCCIESRVVGCMQQLIIFSMALSQQAKIPLRDDGEDAAALKERMGIMTIANALLMLLITGYGVYYEHF